MTHRTTKPTSVWVKNYVHNTMGISKELIQDMINDMVKDELRKVFVKTSLDTMVANAVDRQIKAAYQGTGYFNRDVFKKEVAKILTERIQETIADQLQIDVNVRRSESTQDAQEVQDE